MSLESPAPKLEAFAQSFEGLEEVLEPLLSQPLAQLSKKLQAGSSSRSAATSAAPASASTAAAGSSAEPAQGQQDEPMSQEQIEREGKLASARMYASTAYVLLDLVWMYLKVKGIDPTHHPVGPELERVKAYFHKIKNAKNPEQRDPRSNLDAAAANRFIKHAIGRGAAEPKHKRFDFEKDEDKKPNKDKKEKKSKKEKKPKAGASQATEKPASESSSSNSPAAEPTSASKGKRKSAEIVKSEPSSESTEESAATTPKPKRARMDPFEASGVQDETLLDAPADTSTKSSDAPKPKKKSKKSKGKTGARPGSSP